MTYLNTAAEGIAPMVVGQALQTYFEHKQLGSAGRPLHMQEWNAVRALTGHFFGLTAEEIGVCSCSSEAFDLAALALRLQPGDEVIVNELDFPSGRTPWLQEGSPATVRWWRAQDGALRTEDLIALLSPKTRLVSTSLVSFFNGFTVSLPEILPAIRQHSPAQLALDVTQALGRVSLNLADVDLIISSTHKWICGPHGGGLVGVPSARAEQWTSPAGGWFNLQDAFSPEAMEHPRSKPGAESFMVGMPNFPAIYGIRAALDYILSVGVEAIEEAGRPLVEQCLEGLQELPVELISPRDLGSLAGIVAFRHPEMERIQAYLQEQRVHVMHSAGRMRVALHAYNTPGDVDHFLKTLAGAL
jgi:selenocysteine lyase/cysteine desulfurase